MSCPLCEKLRSRPDEIIAEFTHSVAMLGPWQYYTGYCVLVARRHVPELHHLGDAERRGFVDDLCRLCAAIEAEFRPLKLNVESLGNVVPHLHVHVFPRSESDPERLKAVWLALDRADRDPGEKIRLESGTVLKSDVAQRLRQRLA